MKVFTILITNNATTYGGAQSLRQIVLFAVYAPRLSIEGLEYPVRYTTKYNEYTERLESIEVQFLGSCLTTDVFSGAYAYDEDGRLESSSYGSHQTELEYDELGRVTSYVTSYGGREIQNKGYGYATNGAYATRRLTQIVDNTTNTVESTTTYDGNGRISGVTYGSRTSTYTYDGAGRLTSETNDGITTNYTYDAANNIQKSGLTYTNGKLTAVNGAAIEYDAMGNPVVYKGNTFEWKQGRKLASGTLNGNSFTYTYDGNGMRYKKVVEGEETEYYYNGTQLIAENREDEGRIYYIYDATGIAGMIYYYEYYYFDKNTLGDVVAIRNQSGQVVATYIYDAWGNIDYQSGSIAEINPFRYRGYYYDTETGFYYLQTRYYDPSICRFINADNYELVAQLSETVGQLNLYAYANNNPIMLTDETGEGILLAALVVSFFFGAGISAISQNIQDGSINWLQAGVDGVFTALSVGLAATGIGLGTSMAIGGVMGAAQYGIATTFFGEEFSWSGATYSVVSGLLSGVFSGAGAKNATALANALSVNRKIASVSSVKGLMSFTGNIAFIDVINKEFVRAVDKINIATVLTGAITTFRNLYLVD